MNIVSFFSDLFHPKIKCKIKSSPKKSETTQEAAAKALDRFFSSNRSPGK